MHITGMSEGDARAKMGKKKIVEEIMAEKFPKLMTPNLCSKHLREYNKTEHV